MNITQDDSLLAPGYIFIDPVHGAATKGIGGDQLGPQIREQDGTLVWYGGEGDDFGEQLSGDAAPVRARVQDFHVCDYKGMTGEHLCWSEVTHPGRRHKTIIDQEYNLVEKLVIGKHFGGTSDEYGDLHEFNTVDNGTNFLQPLVPNRKWDLSVLGSAKKGCVIDGCIQDINIQIKTPVFEWCLLDHLLLWETTIFPTNAPNITGNVTSPKIGSGKGFRRSWSHLPDICYDAYHPNAIDKNFEGDYLLSVRHNNQILKIAGNDNTQGLKPGVVMWRLGGEGGNITFEDGFTPFGRQHDVRYLDTTAEETVFSLFDNAWEGALQPTNDFASGLIISVNNVTKSARLLKRYPHPTGGLAPSQGAMQTLPNGNVFVGWGSLSHFSEFTNEGELLLHASYTNRTDHEDIEKAKNEGSSMYYTYSYRLTKSPWVGKPFWQPKLKTYTRDCTSDTQLMAWVSWNGATDVRTWRFFIANHPDGPWVRAGNRPRTGYETEANLSEESLLGLALQRVTFPRYVSVQALDDHGDVLPNGEQVVETFVPRPKMRKNYCTATGCFEDKGFDYDLKLSCGKSCNSSLVPQFLALVLIIFIFEYLDSCFRAVMGMYNSRSDRARPLMVIGRDILPTKE